MIATSVPPHRCSGRGPGIAGEEPARRGQPNPRATVAGVTAPLGSMNNAANQAVGRRTRDARRG
jgi:hypothetical protein